MAEKEIRKEGARLPARQMAAGKPVSYWQRMLERCQPVEKEMQSAKTPAKRLPEADLEAICRTLGDSQLPGDKINLAWWLENLSMLHPQDGAIILCTIGASRRADAFQMEGFCDRVKEAVGGMDCSARACKIVTDLLLVNPFVEKALAVLERDISKYPSDGAAEAVKRGIGHGLRAAHLICRLPEEKQDGLIQKAIASHADGEAEIGVQLLAPRPSVSKSVVMRTALGNSSIREDIKQKLAWMIPALPKELQEMPMLQAVLCADGKVAAFGMTLLEGYGKKTYAMAIGKALADRAPAAIQMMAHIAGQPRKERARLIKLAILSSDGNIEREGMRLLCLEPEKEIRKAAEDLLGTKNLYGSKRTAILPLLMHVREKKRAGIIRESIEAGGEAGKAAFALIGLAREGERAALFHLGCSRLVFQVGKNYPAPIGTTEVFASLSQRERLSAMLMGINGKDEKVRRVFAQLIRQLGKEGLRHLMPKALRSDDSHVFKHAYDLLVKMDVDERKGLCDCTAEEIRDALGREWGDGAWSAASFAPFMKDNPEERKKLEAMIRNTIMRIKAVMLTPYMEESERVKVADASCDSLEEFLRESKSDIEWLGNDLIELIPFQPKGRQERLYELAAEAVGRALEPHDIQGRKTPNGIGMSLAAAIPLLPEEHRPALFAKTEDAIKLELKENGMIHGIGARRLIRTLSHLPRETQVKYAHNLAMSWIGDDEGEKLMEELMPGVLEESRKGGMRWHEW